MLEVNAWLLKDGNRVIGFSVIAEFDEPSQNFVREFPHALSNRTDLSQLEIDGSIMTLHHKQRGTCAFSADEADLKQLKHVLSKRTTRLYNDGLTKTGFKIVLDGFGLKDTRVPMTNVEP